MRIAVDRDSVAMGDDIDTHERVVDVPDGVTLDDLFRRTAPDVSVSGGSTWICEWNGVPIAVQSSGWRTGRVWDQRYATVADLPGGTATPTLEHRYWLQMDADWLLAQLQGGAPLDRRALQELWAPIAAERHEQGLRERERTTIQRLLDARTVAVLEGFGVRIDLHTDTTCRFVLDAGTWVVESRDTMTAITGPRGRAGSLRPSALAPVWVVAMVGAEVSGRGPDALPPPAVESVVDRSPRLWTVTRQVGARQELAQLPSEADAEWFRRTLGRSVDDVAAAYGLRLPVDGPAAAAAPGAGRLGQWVRRLFGPPAEPPRSEAPRSEPPRSEPPRSDPGRSEAPPLEVPPVVPPPAEPLPTPAVAVPEAVAAEAVDLPVPEEVWRRWSAMAVALACLGVDDVYWSDAGGAHHDDHGGSQAHLVLGSSGSAVMYGWDREHAVRTREDAQVDLLAGAPDWSPFPHLHRLAADRNLGWFCWYVPATGWRRAADPPGSDGGSGWMLAPVLTADGADVELRDVQTEWPEQDPADESEEAAMAVGRQRLLAAAAAGAVDETVLQVLFPHLDAERVDVEAGLAAASRCGVTAGATPPRLGEAGSVG